MDIQETAQQLQTFADANGLDIDCSVAVNEMDAGDFIEINQAMDNSDNRTIMQILQKYKARLSESYKYFYSDMLVESYGLNFINSLAFTDLETFYKMHEPSAFSTNEHLSLAEMKTLAYDVANSENVKMFLESKLKEDVKSQLTSNVIANANNKEQQQQVNPQTQAKMKQAELQRNSGNNAMQVTVPGDQQGTSNVAPVVGVDPGPTPQQTLVVTKDPQKQNQLSVYGLDDVNPINQQGQVNMAEDYNPAQKNQELMGPGQQMPTSGGPSPLTHTEPGIGEIIQAISHIEADDNVHGDESPLGNSSMDAENDIIAQIIDNCSKIRGR